MPESRRKRRPLSSAAAHAAAFRVEREGEVPLSSLCELASASLQTLKRWVTAGKRGVHLDAIRRRDGRWTSSVVAYLRFAAEVKIRELAAEGLVESP